MATVYIYPCEITFYDPQRGHDRTFVLDISSSRILPSGFVKNAARQKARGMISRWGSPPNTAQEAPITDINCLEPIEEIE